MDSIKKEDQFILLSSHIVEKKVYKLFFSQLIINVICFNLCIISSHKMILFNHIIYLLQILQVVKEKSMALLKKERKRKEKENMTSS